MPEPLLVLVTGPPGSGKSTIGNRLGVLLALPVVTKDEIKETLFDSLGWSDRQWSKRLGSATFALLWHFVEVQIRARRSLLVEANFDARRARDSLAGLRKKVTFEAVEIHCFAEPEVLIARYAARSSTRHPGHVDDVAIEDIREGLQAGHWAPIQFGCNPVMVDTGNVDVDVGALAAAIDRGSRMP